MNAHPLVYGGEGGLGAYFTHPPGWNRPFAIINLPHAAFDNVWQWLALPHETGHDLYAAVKDLTEELENALDARMRSAVTDGEVIIPDVDVQITISGAPYTISYSGADFLAKIWRAWANESQADIVGLLNCGGAAIIALQQIIGFEAEDSWSIGRDDNGGWIDMPEEHPTSYVRNILNIEALRMIDSASHSALADEIDERFSALRPEDNNVVWTLGRDIEVASVPIDQMAASAKIAAQVLLNHRLSALGNRSYSEIATFTAYDQGLVNEVVQPLIDGDPAFMQVEDGIEPRHALAATIFAFEKAHEEAHVINRTFQHFL